jgi:hypothetical protein
VFRAVFVDVQVGSAVFVDVEDEEAATADEAVIVAQLPKVREVAVMTAVTTTEEMEAVMEMVAAMAMRSVVRLVVDVVVAVVGHVEEMVVVPRKALSCHCHLTTTKTTLTHDTLLCAFS